MLSYILKCPDVNGVIRSTKRSLEAFLYEVLSLTVKDIESYCVRY